jgi:hypothetical protein
MKKIIIIITILFLSLILFFLFYKKKQFEKIDNTIKKISRPNEIKYTVETTFFSKNRNVKNHFTNLEDFIFYSKEISITKGGIVKGEVINRYYNATEFKKVTSQDNKIIIGYRDGFLLLTEKYINHFIFNEEVKKCVFSEDLLYCIKNNLIMLKNGNSFTEYFKSNDKIIDLIKSNNKFYILTEKKLIIKDKYSEIKLDTININKLLDLDGDIYGVSDREIFKIENNSIISFKKVSSIDNLILKNKKIYYVSINGVIYDDELKKIYSLNTLVNRISYIDDIIYILTPNGVYTWKNDVEKFNINFISNTIAENYITNITKYNNSVLFSYFNSGIDILNKDMTIKPFISNLNGVNDILIHEDNIYVATTNGLYLYNNNKELKHYGKKDGIIGTSVSNVKWYQNNIFIGSEGGISQKTGDLFHSINGMHGLVNNRVNCLKIVNSNLYVGTLGGVSVLNNLKVVKNLKNNDFKSRWITSIENVNDDIYISTYGGGIYKLKNNEMIEITKKEKRLFVNLNTLLNYKNVYLLAGTLKNGIFVYNIKKNEYFFIKDLPSLNITAINIIDDEIFIGSDFGFWNIDVKDVLE